MNTKTSIIYNKSPIIAWFSCGAASAVATLLTLRMYSYVLIYRIDTGSEHEDNKRFVHECEEKLFKQKVIQVKSNNYKSVAEVLLKRKFINSPYGAPCTYELKKKVRYRIEDDIKKWEGQVFGFDISEKKRATRFLEQYPNARPIFPLIDANLSKSDCLAIIESYKIKLPTMYLLGYNNNNCIGCVKGGKGYWNMIRQDFPTQFSEMANLERKIGHSCIKDCYLDELQPQAGRKPGILPECSIFCALEFMNE